MLHTIFKIPEPRSSGGGDVKVYFIFEPKTSATGPFSTPRPPFLFQPHGHHLKKFSRSLQDNATNKFKASDPSGSGEDDF